MQYMANLSDREATEAVAARIDWKYARLAGIERCYESSLAIAY